MTAQVVPFPRTRNGRWIAGLAGRLRRMRPDTAESHLLNKLAEHYERMLCRGVRPTAADREIAELEAAIRCELWRQEILGDIA